VVVVAAIAAILVFVVFGVGGGGTAAATPEGTVNRFLAAMEAKDIDKVLDLMDPQVRDSLVKVGGLNDAKQTLSDTMFPFKSVKFSNIELSTTKSSDTSASVTINAGTATIIGNDGKSTKSDIATEMPITFDLMQKDGSWYLLSSSFF
jgi:ketosteroid isomerase-like protein